MLSYNVSSLCSHIEYFYKNKFDLNLTTTNTHFNLRNKIEIPLKIIYQQTITCNSRILSINKLIAIIAYTFVNSLGCRL